MPLDPRSSPQEVAALFDAPLTNSALADALNTLRRAPNWHVCATASPTAYDLNLLYRPAGAPPLTVHLEHTGSPTEPSVWHKPLSRRAAEPVGEAEQERHPDEHKDARFVGDQL